MTGGQAAPRGIRCVMLPVTGGRVLVPSSMMAEVITYVLPAPIVGAPAWLLGRVAWRGWEPPVLSFSALAGVATQEPGAGARVAVLKALGGHPGLSYFGVLTHGFPRLTLVAEEALCTDANAQLPPGVREQVIVHDDPAWIPDLANVEDRVAGVLAAAAG